MSGCRCLRIMPAPLLLLVVAVLGLPDHALAAPDDDPGPLAQQVGTLVEAGKYEEAIQIQEKLVEIATRILGPEDPQTALTLSNLSPPRFAAELAYVIERIHDQPQL